MPTKTLRASRKTLSLTLRLRQTINRLYVLPKVVMIQTV
jgi:hypothetical protein